MELNAGSFQNHNGNALPRGVLLQSEVGSPVKNTSKEFCSARASSWPFEIPLHPSLATDAK
jgi:hypothetical protein